MKAIKKISAIVICLCLALSCICISAYAAPEAGSITIKDQSGTNATVAGKTLNLFKIFNATTSGSNISYSWINDGGVNRYEDFFKEIMGDQTITINDVVDYIIDLEGNALAFSQMATALHDYIHEVSITADKSSADDYDGGLIPAGTTQYTFDELSLGYYLIYDATDLTGVESAVRSAAMLAHPGQNKVIELKADRPHIEKYVYDHDTVTSGWKLGTTAKIGETVNFKITTAIPDHTLYGEHYTFIISDKMDDTLSLAADNFTVKVGDTTWENYTPVAQGDNDFIVTIEDAHTLPAGTAIEITYSAVVTKEAEKVNNNTVTLTYSNDPNDNDPDDTPSTGTVSATATVSVWDYVITKFMENADGQVTDTRLAGAEFEIYEVTGTGDDEVATLLKFSTVTEDGKTKYVVDKDGTATVTTIASGDDIGKIFLFGLGEGKYRIRETKAPDGYLMADTDFELTLTDRVNAAGAVDFAQFALTPHEAPGKFTDITVDKTNLEFHIGITNAPGEALPETGGMGTTLFTVLGIILMAGAVAFFTSRKRSSVA